MPRLPLVRLAALLTALALPAVAAGADYPQAVQAPRREAASALPAVAAGADYPQEQLKADLKLFEAAKLPHGDQDLLNFFQSRVLADKDRGRLADLIGKLSSKSYKERQQASTEIEKAGPPVLPLLRNVLQSNVDLETKQRAERCLKAIEAKSPNTLVMAGARLLTHRRVPGAVAVLLDYAAFVPDEIVEEEVFASLYSLALVGAKLEVLPPAVKSGALDPRMEAALHDNNPTRRAIAALIVARYGNAEQRKAVAKLLTDEVPAVRFRAAQGLAIGSDKSGIPVMLELLTQGPMNYALQAEDLLSLIAQEKGPTTPLGETKELRQKCHDAWKEWWEKNGSGVELNKIEVDSPFGGLESRASKAAMQFVQAMELLEEKQDATLLAKVTDVPFTFGGLITFKTRQEFDDFVNMQLKVAKPAQQKEIKYKVVKVLPGAQYVKSAGENERGFLEASRLNQVHVVYVQVQEVGQNVGLPLFIRVSAGRGRCIGFGTPMVNQ